MRETGKLTAGHGMPSKENRADFFDKQFRGGLPDALLGAAGIGDQRMRRGVLREFRQKIQSVGDGQSNVDQIGAANGGFQGFEKTFINRARFSRFQNHFGAVPADDVDVCRIFAKSARE